MVWPHSLWRNSTGGPSPSAIHRSPHVSRVTIDRIQLESLLGQAVLEAVGMIPVRAAGQDAVVDEHA